MSRPRKPASDPQIDDTIDALLPLYSAEKGDRPDSIVGAYPNPLKIEQALRGLLDVMLPGRMSHDPITARDLRRFVTRRLAEASKLLRPEIERALPFRWIGEASRHEKPAERCNCRVEAEEILRRFRERLPEVRHLVIEDVKAAYEGDPAALTYAEVQIAYPGLLAIVSHRLAHELYQHCLPIIPRVMSEWVHSMTGVDINPGARIGRGFFIDHGTGVVIGETTVIGDRVKLYQGVTLGARSFALDAHGNPIKHIKRHPTVEDDVVIYANATILGGDTVIGQGSVIGGNVFLMESVPPYSVVSANHPELRIKRPDDPKTDWVI